MPEESAYINDANIRSMKTAGKTEHEIAEELGVTTMDVEEALIRTMPISKLEEKP